MAGDMACTDPRSGGQWTAAIEGSYASSGYDLRMVMEMPSLWDSGQMQLTSRTTGRRLGPCEPPQKAPG